MNVTRTECPIIMLNISKNQISRNFGPLIGHGPHWINFTIVTFLSENNIYLEAYIKFGTKLFHST
jgi:hypothetical protein